MSQATEREESARADWRDDPERWATERGRFIKRTTQLDDTDAEIVAYAELGFSSAGIAKKIELGHSTVKSHFEEIKDNAVTSVLMTRKPDQLAIRSPIGLEGL